MVTPKRGRGTAIRHGVPRHVIKFSLLELVALKHDMPEHGLRAGDVGAVVETYDSDGLEVEFVEASGDTRAVLTLSPKAVRKPKPGEMLAIRSLAP
jgi:hypothetical protein